jgi:hypothetical protein
MSSLSQFAPFASGGLKSFQTGFVSTSSASSGSGEDIRFLDVAISSVSTSKAIPNMFGSGARADIPIIAAYSWAGDNITVGIVLPRLTSSTNLRLSVNGDLGAYGGTTTAIVGRWQVAEAN